MGDVVEKFRAKYGSEQVERYYSKLDVAVEIPLAWVRTLGRAQFSDTSSLWDRPPRVRI